MTESWKKEFYEKLSEIIGKCTEENRLFQDNEQKEWTLKSVFALFPEKYVMVQAVIFQLKPDFVHMELFTVLNNDVSDETLRELEKAVMELNYYSPIGAFGIHYKGKQLFVRNCYLLDENKDMDALMKEVITIYDIIMEGLQGAYPGLEAIWTGQMSFDEAVEKKLLRKYTK